MILGVTSTRSAILIAYHAFIIHSAGYIFFILEQFHAKYYMYRDQY